MTDKAMSAKDFIMRNRLSTFYDGDIVKDTFIRKYLTQEIQERDQKIRHAAYEEMQEELFNCRDQHGFIDSFSFPYVRAKLNDKQLKDRNDE